MSLLTPATEWQHEKVPEPAQEEQSEGATYSRLKAESGNFLFVPSGDVRLSDTADALFRRIARSHQMFSRGGAIVELRQNDHKGLVISILKPSAARSRFEKNAQFAKYIKDPNSNGYLIKPVSVISKDLAEALLDSQEAITHLPCIAGLINCPVAVEVSDGKLEVLGPGYNERTGLLVTGGATPAVVPLSEAVEALLKLQADFDFTTPEDRSRAIASLLTPALKLGGHLRDSIPADVAEADQSQSGKTYRQNVIAAIYNERLSLVSSKAGGVGSVDETFNEQLVSGRPFIQFDNLRGKFASAHIEAFLTCDGLFAARVPHKGKIDVDPSRYFLFLTSNGVDLIRDMANRSNIIAIRKRPPGYDFQTFRTQDGGTVDLLGHVREKQAYYLGCIFTVIGEWLRHGKPRSTETRHDRREWCQTLDWIVQHIFELPPMMGGHREMQTRVSTPGLVFLRQVCLVVEAENRLGAPLKATDIYELCIGSDIEIPGVEAPRRGEEEHARKIVGNVINRALKAGENQNEAQIDGYRFIRSEEQLPREDGKGSFTSRLYTVIRAGGENGPPEANYSLRSQ